MLGAVVLSAAILAVGLPVRALLADHSSLSAASASLNQVQQENHQLSVEQAQLASKSELARLARKQYQMVLPGQHLYDVLPLAGSKPDGTPASGAAGDPGANPPVAPSEAPGMQPDPGLATASPASSQAGGSAPGAQGSASSGASPGFWRRVADTLEFWR